MLRFLQKPYRWGALWALLLTGSAAFVLLDAFVIPREQTPLLAESATATEAHGVEVEPGEREAAATEKAVDGESTAGEPERREATGEREGRERPASSGEAPGERPSGGGRGGGDGGESIETADTTNLDASYEDENISIGLTAARAHDTDYYVAEIRLSSVEYLRTAFAQGSYGRNIKENTSEIAQNNNAILAINGDYYGFRDSGGVLRNGVWYRDSFSGEELVIDSQGNFSLAKSAERSAAENPWQIFSFGPTLVEEGQVVVDSESEVAKSRGDGNPRTAIGQISPLHYVFIVSDGRTSESTGLSLLALAEIFADLGCQSAYNLDGGGSSTLYFDGEIINKPTTSGRTIREREVSDIVYIGYPAE